MMIIYLILSTFLESIVNLLVSEKSLFIPLFSILSLIIIYIHLEKKDHIYIYSLVLGIVYDIAYTQTPFMNTLLFLLTAFLIQVFYKYVPYHIVSTSILTVIVIILYRLTTYILYVIFNDIKFNINELFQSIYLSMISNIIYIILSYLIFKLLKNKRRKLNKYSYIK